MSALRKTKGYTGSSGWHLPQPTSLFGESIERQVNAYTSEATAGLDKYADFLTDLTQSLPVQVETIGPCVKDRESSLRKVWDRTTRYHGKPGLMTDYLRATIVVPESDRGISNLVSVMNILMEHPDVVAFKDQFYNPNEETGFRSFKALPLINGHKAELLVKYEGTREGDDITAKIRLAERQLRDAQVRLAVSTNNNSIAATCLTRIGSDIEKMITILRGARSVTSDNYAHACGLDVLLSEEAAKSRQIVVMNDFVKAAKLSVKDSHFKQRLESTLELLLQAPSPRGMN